MSLEACLPDHLRGPTTSITRIVRGLSGAGVYRVEAAGHAYVLKVAREGEPVEAWRQRLEIQRRAGDAGVAPRVIHHDEARRAVVSDHIVDRGFAPRLFDPQTRDGAIRELGETIRRVHALSLPADAVRRDPRDLIAPVWAQLAAFTVPRFVRSTIDQVLAETPPPRQRPLVTSHNDANPSNLVFDGERLLLLDWDMAGPNDPFYDLAAVAMFLRMDDPTASALIAAYDAGPPAALPEGFVYARRLVAALCATIFLHLARHAGHAGGGIPADRAPTLLDVHGLIRTGALAPNTAEGAWAFALALVRTITDHAGPKPAAGADRRTCSLLRRGGKPCGRAPRGAGGSIISALTNISFGCYSSVLPTQQGIHDMTFDVGSHLGCMTRAVRDLEWDGRPAKGVIASRVFDTDAADLWDAITNPERIPRWFSPISGDLRLGGRYQIEGNAGGEITTCKPPSDLAVTWEYSGTLSWVKVQLVPEAGGTRLELEHIAHSDGIGVPEEFRDHWEKFGPGAAGVGWDLGFLGLARHLADPDAAMSPEEAMQWMVSDEAKEMYRITSNAWGQAAIAAGEPEPEALAAAERTRAFYSGEAPAG